LTFNTGYLNHILQSNISQAERNRKKCNYDTLYQKIFF